MSDYIYNIYEAKTRLSHLVDRAAKGEEVIIAKAGVPLAKLVPMVKPKKRRTPGGWEGKVHIADDFDAPLPPDLRMAFDGRPYEAQ